MKLEHIELLMKNPYSGSEIITHFASGFGEKEIPLHLFYLVLPLVLYKPSRQVFSNINHNNHLSLILKDNREIAANFQNRISEMKELTNLSLIVATNRNWIQIDTNVTLINSLDYNKSLEKIKEIHRAAHYFGIILHKEKSYVHVFKHFKVLPK